MAVAQLGREAIDDVGLRAAEDDAVVAVNLVIVVGVGKLQVAGLGCLTIDGGQFRDVLALLHNARELQAVEGTQRLAAAQNLLLVAALNHVVSRAHVGNLVVVIGRIGAEGPLQVLALNKMSVDGKFEALVHHVTHVLKL